jgi:hypothetical protein
LKPGATGVIVTVAAPAPVSTLTVMDVVKSPDETDDAFAMTKPFRIARSICSRMFFELRLCGVSRGISIVLSIGAAAADA